MADPIAFLNADLEVSSERSLEPLRDGLLAWPDLHTEMCCEQTDNGFFARFEIHPEGIEIPTASQLIHAFCDSIDRLDGETRAVWDEASNRAIDLGYQCSDHCSALPERIDSPTLQRMASMGIDLAITIYPQTIENGPATNK